MCLMWTTWAICQQQKGTRRGEHKAMCVLYNTSRPRNLMRCHALSSALPSPCVKRTIPISSGHHTLLWSVERVLRFDVFQHRERPLWSRPPQEGAQGLARVSTHRERKEGAAYAYRGCCCDLMLFDTHLHDGCRYLKSSRFAPAALLWGGIRSASSGLQDPFHSI